MSTEKRQSASVKSNIGTGPYLAKVVSHLDPTFMGTLQVTLLRRDGNLIGDESQSYSVSYAPPFYGSTAFEFMGYNKDDFNDTQKSYGMWFVPPDPGVTVIVFFVDGDPAQGFWMGCVPGRFTNHMIPAMGASSQTELSADDKRKYDTTQPLPIGEINRKINPLDKNMAIEKIKAPVHPIADAFLLQGLLEDDIRGPTTSTSRRNVPNMVSGISTPGPVDKRQGAARRKIGKIQSQTETPVPVSRLGGTTLVFDDGDDRYIRKKPASELGQGQAYADVLEGEKGDPTIPYNEYFRVRTRTGHQILLHNSEDLIYIGNAKGTAWVELTSNGKIDIFSEDSISIHTKNDLNIRADRDINMEAGRNVNIKATAEYASPDSLYNDKGIFDSTGAEKGRVQIESVENFNLLIGRNGKIHVRNDEDIQGNLDIKVIGNMRIAVQDKDSDPTHTNVEDGTPGTILEEQPEDVKGLHIYSYENTRILTEKNVDITTGGNVKIKTYGNLDINTSGNNAYTAGGATDIKSGGNHTETATQIHMNGPAARTAEVAEPAEVADKILQLHLHENIVTNKDLAWQKERYVEKTPLQSILTRIPMHEPWPLHENFLPDQLTPDKTDREL